MPIVWEMSKMKQSHISGPLDTVALAMTLLFTFCASSAAWNEPPECRDNTPHREQFVTVAPGVKLEVLDWGGSGEAMVLLTGLGDNAHVYDQFAFQFTDYFHVIGITRRGYFPSSQPEDGYDVRTRVSDDIAVLDALGIHKAVLVGHSVAGSELSAAAELYKNRVDKLVYLDSYDLAGRFDLPEIPPHPAFTSADLRSLWTFQAARARLEGVRIPDSAACIALQFNPDGAMTGTTTPDWVGPKILEDVNKNPSVNWAKIVAPRLGIFAVPSVQSRQPWYWYLDPAEQALFDERWPAIVNWFTATIQKFANGNPVRPLILPNVPHYVYINNETDVVRAMRTFLGIPLQEKGEAPPSPSLQEGFDLEP